MDLNNIFLLFKNNLKSKWLLPLLYLFFTFYISFINDNSILYYQKLYDNLYFRLVVLSSIFIITQYDPKISIMISICFLYIIMNLNEKKTNSIIDHLSKYLDNNNNSNLTYLNYEKFDNYNNDMYIDDNHNIDY